jgi:beta-N-acetylhexosaminidase
MLLVGYRGKTLVAGSSMDVAIRQTGIGGVILFDRNIDSPQQLLALTKAMRKAAGDRPFLIAVDQEGGAVARLNPSNGFPSTPSEASIGAADDASQAQAIGQTTGQTLAGMRINLNLAPVVDLNVNPTNPSIGALGRSYSADPDVVVDMATAVINGMHQSGVMATLKHYPGLGSATGDTDREFVDVTKTWTARELKPFARLVADGVPDAVMVANALNGQIDAQFPASLSSATVNGLRNDLGWEGVVVTDDLQAGALRDSYTPDQIVRHALAATDDLLLFANTQLYELDIATSTVASIVNLVQRGIVDEARIDASVARIERMIRTRAPG